MKTKLLPILLTCACATLARADFNPIALTPGSFTYDIVVEASAPAALPYCINVTAGNGVALGDFTYFEQGFYSRVGQSGGNFGVPIHNTTFANINNANMSFLMPPDYTQNNDLMVDATYNSGYGFTFITPTNATSLAILNCGGGGTVSIGYTVTHADNSTETGTLNLLDWFNGGGTVAWGANARVNSGGGYQVPNNSSVNNGAPYLYANTFPVSGASPVVSISFSYSSGQHANLFAVSANNGGSTWTPVPVTGFNVKAIVPASFPLTATMDQGTNTVNNGNLATWFEVGYVQDPLNPSYASAGLPASGSTFTSVNQPTHHYQMGNYSANNATLIDAGHLVANITPAAPAPYSAFSFLTAGGDIGGNNVMTNICILQHQDGVNETNLFYGYDWYNNAVPPAFISNGRVNMYSRTVNTINSSPQNPRLFESYFLLADTSSAVTNIILQYKTAPAGNSTTYVMAVSATAGGVPALVASGPSPSTATIYPSQTNNFSVTLSGTAPVGGYWQVENNGIYYNLTDGLDANGSTFFGSQTTSLTISNAYVADSTNYQFVATNAFGTNISLPAVLIVNPQTISITPAAPLIYQSNNLTLAVNLSPGAPVALQWYYIDNSSVSNNIPGATNATLTISNVPLTFSGYTYGVVATNIYGVNSTNAVLTVSSSAAFLGTDLRPLTADAYVGAPVTYGINALGDSPISYQWTTNGTIDPSQTGSTYTLAATCGTNTIQVAFSNALSSGAISSSPVQLVGITYPGTITFNTNGTGWQTNGAGGSVPTFVANNVIQLTDGGGGEASSAYYNTAQYVGGTWKASFTYNSHAGGADGATFVLQTAAATALGGTGGQLGYGPLTNSLAFEINLYPGNNQTIGVAIATNGTTGIYGACAPVVVNGTNNINVSLNCSNGVLSATLTDAVTAATFTTNYNFGSLVPILGANVAYIGVSGGDGGITSTQTISNFSFTSILTPVSLGVSPVTANSFIISWPAADPSYVLQMSPSLSAPSWGPAPSPTVVGGFNHVSVTVPGGSGQQFYRLMRMVCQ